MGDRLGPADARTLLWYAVAAVRSGLQQRPVPGIQAPTAGPLTALGATFVTLERGPTLLGCIGNLDAVRPLYEDVMSNAYKSAFADPRLPAVTTDDYAVMDVKVSVLTPLERLGAVRREELVAKLEPGVDGLLLIANGFRATFLPGVWSRLATAEHFVEQLLHKGGATGWLPGLEAFRYRATEYAQPGPRPPFTL